MRVGVELGVVTTAPAASPVPGADLAARHVTVELVPGGRKVDCRVVNLGQGSGKGAFLPLAVGDEVLVLFPGGDPNAAVAIGGLGNGTAPNPTENDGDHALLMHPGGVALRAVTGAPSYRIVHEQFLADLQKVVTALMTFMGSTAAVPETDPSPGAIAIGTAASVFTANPDVIAFVGQLTAALSAGPPYAAALHKVD